MFKKVILPGVLALMLGYALLAALGFLGGDSPGLLNK